MLGARQREWLTDLLEGLPSLVFVVLWRGGADLELAGWIGTGTAAAVLVGLRRLRVPFNPVLLGINLHLLAITPLIEAVFLAGATELGRLLLAFAESGVLVAVAVVGGVLTVVSRRGFIGADGLPAATRRAYSLLLLAVAAAAVPWSLAHADSPLLSIAVPLMLLFGLRRFLLARWRDRARPDGTGALGLAAGGAAAAEPAAEAS